jgi:hypothetical protein
MMETKVKTCTCGRWKWTEELGWHRYTPDRYSALVKPGCFERYYCKSCSARIDD